MESTYDTTTHVETSNQSILRLNYKKDTRDVSSSDLLLLSFLPNVKNQHYNSTGLLGDS